VVLGAWIVTGHADTLSALRHDVEAAYQNRDAARIDVLHAAIVKAGGDSSDANRATYLAAYARLRQSGLPGLGKEQIRNYLEQCIDELEPLVKRKPDYAEARALHASCLGASSQYYVLRAATRGMAANREMAAALRLAPDNPWVALQDAVSDFMTPKLFGGDPARALTKLQRVERLFVTSRPAGSSQPVFGEAETWLYIGRVQKSLGQPGPARKALERAREMAPDNADVRDELAKLGTASG
jgi:tetratricopeptide (TPR) repeat protein